MKIHLIAPLTILLAGTAAADVHVLTATLEGSQALPPVVTSGSGTASITVDDVSGFVHVQGSYDNLSGTITSLHLHGLAPVGAGAGPLFALMHTGGSTGTFEGSSTLSAGQISGVLDGLSYVNMHSTTNAPGELRGQGVFDALAYDGQLDGTQAGTASTALGDYMITIDRRTNQVSVQGNYSGLLGAITAAHLHGPAWFGQSAAPFVILTHTGGTTGTFSATAVAVSDVQLDDIIDGFTYLNLHTAMFGGGEIRGQVTAGTLGIAYCQPTDNSTGAPGMLVAIGSPRAVDNDVTLMASDLPLNSFGYIIASQSSGQTFPVAASQGRICIVGPNIGRLGSTIQSSGASGTMSASIDLTLIPGSPPSSVVPGDTWNFQTWHRDSMGGVVTSNFTNAVSTSFR